MTRIEEKALHFLVALSDVYQDEDDRELDAFSKMSFSEDVTEDFTAMLLAMNLICEKVTGFDGDLIDFTHMLNKLTVQHVMNKQEDNNG